MRSRLSVSVRCIVSSLLQAVLQMPVEVQSELCRQNLIPSFPQSRRSIVAEHPLILVEQLLMNEKVCVFILHRVQAGRPCTQMSTWTSSCPSL